MDDGLREGEWAGEGGHVGLSELFTSSCGKGTKGGGLVNSSGRVTNSAYSGTI